MNYLFYLLILNILCLKCLAQTTTTRTLGLYGNCYGGGVCASNLTCYVKFAGYAECRSPGQCPSGWGCQDQTHLPMYSQCGASINNTCSSILNLTCFLKFAGYSECRNVCPTGWGCQDPNKLPLYAKCGGTISTSCTSILNLTCYAKDSSYSECRNVCPSGWSCSVSTPTGMINLKNVNNNNGIISVLKTTTSSGLPLYSPCKKMMNTNESLTCANSLACFARDAGYSECRDACPEGWACKDPSRLPIYSPCGANINNTCSTILGLSCYNKLGSYSECRDACPEGWACKDPSRLPIYSPCGANINNTCSTILGLSCFNKFAGYSECRDVCPVGWGCQDPTNLPLYAQCGGDISAQCSSLLGLSCFYKTPNYATCLTSCPSGYLCSTTTTTTTTTTTVTPYNGPTSTTLPSEYFGLQNCTFKFGMWYYWNSKVNNFESVDYLVISIGYWSGGSNGYRSSYHGAMLETCKKYNKLPVFNAYFIGFMGNYYGLPDCNVGPAPNLCSHGADMIRNRTQEILDSYRNFSFNVAQNYGTFFRCVWLIEPDYYQYYSADQSGRPLDGYFMRTLFDNIAVQIKTYLPNAIISWDISGWASKSQMTTYWSFFASSPYINYIHTSGGVSEATVKINRISLEWSFMSNLTGRKIIADTGYDFNGRSTGFNLGWNNVTSLQARIQDGVIAITQATPTDTWSDDLSIIRPKLPNIC